MTRFDARTPADRRALYTEAIQAHRQRGSDHAVVAAGNTRLVLGEAIRFEVTGEERRALSELLSEYPVFKITQPATRRADESVVFVSAVTDAKHLADFLDDAFQRVYGLDPDYVGWVIEV